MRTLTTLTLAAVLAAPLAAEAAYTCPDAAPAAIAAPGSAARKCQTAIAREATKYLAVKLQVLSACRLQSAAGTCPAHVRGADVDTILKAATKAQANIAKACDADAAQAALGSSWKTGTDATALASCVLSQQSVAGDLVSAETNGATTEAWPGTGKERAACVKEVSASGAALAALLVRNADACLSAHAKQGGDLAALCVGSYSGNAFVPPTDGKTAAKQRKALAKLGGKVARKCGPADQLHQIPTLFSCAGAANVDDLKACLSCSGVGAMIESVDAQWGESGTYVANGPGALQAAVDAAAPGAKLLIGSGDYQEEVLIATNGLHLVGCGAATTDRPRIIPPATQTNGRGIRAFNVDGLLFQSLVTFGQSSDGIFVSGADGVTFRDIVGDGNDVSKYAVFPVRSNNVKIELCTVTRVADAGVYVGQSATILVRHNDVRNSVAGTEFENSANGRAYGNFATNNTGALLVFKDPSLPVQYAQCHEVDHNVFDGNNHTNFGVGTVGGVPVGTGILVIAADSTPFHHNIARNHNTFGFALINQALSGFPAPFSTDPEPDHDLVFANVFMDNGLAPDTQRSPVGADAVSLNQGTELCQSDNVFGLEVGFKALPACTLPVPTFAGCPAGPVTRP